MADAGAITSDDTLFFDDFWTPGFETLPYAFKLMGIKPKMYAYCWAQSVDKFDFTANMKPWIQNFEKGIADVLDGIFVACPTMRALLTTINGTDYNKIHPVGLPFDSGEVMRRMPTSYINRDRLKDQPRQNKVVFSSRWDTEKNPWFFLKVAEEVLKQRDDVQFVVCTSAEKLRSNNPELINLLHIAMDQYPTNIILKEDLTKEGYYAELASAKIQFNCADQDFVSFTLLEASVAGCYPVYPFFRSFPETFLYQKQYMYKHLDAEDAASMILTVLKLNQAWASPAIKARSWIHERYDTTWARMLSQMGIVNPKYLTLPKGPYDTSWVKESSPAKS
jgi:glycosyltransferase involved in cell wall biosynthesis